jgi:hypothetical protein
MYHGTLLRRDPMKINKDRRKKIKISMIIDEIEGRIRRFMSQSQSRT